jgi:hypothetical protein
MSDLRVVLTLAAVLLCGASPAAPPRPAAEKPSPLLWIAIARGGVLRPFAQLHDGKWTNAWPSPIQDPRPAMDESVEKLSIKDVPREWLGRAAALPLEWYRADSGKTGPVQSLERIPSACQLDWALVVGGPIEQDLQAGGQTSVATNVRNGISIVPLQARALPVPLLQPVLEAFEAGESRALKNPKRDPGHPTQSFERQKTLLNITNVVRVGPPNAPGGELFYFEASRGYPKRAEAKDPKCDAVTRLSGWALVPVGAEEGKVIQSEASLGDCDGVEGTFLTPLGYLQRGASLFVVAVRKGYETEEFVILELGKDQVKQVLAVDSGGC